MRTKINGAEHERSEATGEMSLAELGSVRVGQVGGCRKYIFFLYNFFWIFALICF
jgi:hypothetical protein